MGADPTDISSPQRRMSSSEVAAVANVSSSYVRQLARAGKLGATRSTVDGRDSWSFDADAVDAWARDRNTQSRLTESADNWERDLLIAEANDARHQLALSELEIEIRKRDAIIAEQAGEVRRLAAEVARLKLATKSLVSGMDAMLTDPAE